jgi:hypothetical protein
MKRMHIGEEEVSLSQPITVVVPPFTVPPEEEVPQGPAVVVPPEEEEVLAPPIMVPLEGRECLIVAVDRKVPDDECLVPPLVSSLKKCRRFFFPFFLINTVDL